LACPRAIFRFWTTPPTAEAGSDTGSVIMDGRSYVDNVVVYARPIQD
jgi:hypothetical protein